jgi:hypothetical protein
MYFYVHVFLFYVYVFLLLCMLHSVSLCRLCVNVYLKPGSNPTAVNKIYQYQYHVVFSTPLSPRPS